MEARITCSFEIEIALSLTTKSPEMSVKALRDEAVAQAIQHVRKTLGSHLLHDVKIGAINLLSV